MNISRWHFASETQRHEAYYFGDLPGFAPSVRLEMIEDDGSAHFAMRLYGLPDFEANQPGFDGDGASGDHTGKAETSDDAEYVRRNVFTR